MKRVVYMTFSEMLYLIIMFAFVSYASCMVINREGPVFKTLDLITLCNLNWVAYSVFMLIQPFLKLLPKGTVYNYVFWAITMFLWFCGKYSSYVLITKRKRISWSEALVIEGGYLILILIFNFLYSKDMQIMDVTNLLFACFVLGITYFLYNERQRNVSYVYAYMLIGSILLYGANSFFKVFWADDMFVLIQMGTLFLSLTGVFFYFYEYYSFEIVNQKNNLNKLEEDLSKANEAINEMAYYHPVTKFPNHAMLMKDWAIQYKDQPLKTLGIIEIANWHQVEHRYESWSRDSMLKEVVNRMGIRESFKHVYHIRDNEFAVVAACGVEMLQQQLDSHIDQFIKKQSQTSLQCVMEIYSGLAEIINHKEFGQTLHEANIACQMAFKRNKYVMVYEPGFKALIDEEISFESQLRQAVHKGQWNVHYQPKIKVDDESICGAEALIRWAGETTHEVYYAPSYFIPLAEKLGLIHEIGDVIINEVFKASHQFTEIVGDDFEYSINVSPLQLHDQQFVERIEWKIKEFDIKPERFIFEITESAEIMDYEDVIDKLKRLKQLGFKISLDDFGVGYSNLHSIPELPIDEIKFDKLITDRLTSTDEYLLVMEYFLLLSKKLKLKTVIEGIEVKDQVQIIKELGVDECQGYYYSKPLDRDAFYSYLLNQRKVI